MVKVSCVRYGTVQTLIRDERICRLFRAVRDTSAAFAHARLFICSPHSCEVVKTVFFTLFWRREPQKGTARWQPAGSCSVKGRKKQARQPMQDLSGRLSVGEAVKLPGSIGECGARSGDVLIIGGDYSDVAGRNVAIRGFYCSVCQAARRRWCQRRFARAQTRASAGSSRPSQAS